MNRYSTPIQVNTQLPRFQMDWGLIQGALGQLQGQYNAYNEARMKTSNYLPVDANAATALREEYDLAAEEVANQYSSGIVNGRRSMNDTLTTIRQDWQPGGRYYQMGQRVQQQQAIDEKIHEQYGDDPMVENYVKAVQRNGNQSMYDPNTGQWNVNASLGSVNTPRYISPDEVIENIREVAFDDLKMTLLRDPSLPPQTRMLLQGANNIMEISRVKGITQDRILNTLAGLIPQEHYDAMSLYAQSSTYAGRPMDPNQQLFTEDDNGKPVLNTNGIIGRAVASAMAGAERYDIDSKVTSWKDPYLDELGRQRAMKGSPMFLPSSSVDITIDQEVLDSNSELIAGANEVISNLNADMQTLQSEISDLQNLSNPTSDQLAQLNAKQLQLSNLQGELATARHKHDNAERLLIEVEDQIDWDWDREYENYLQDIEEYNENPPTPNINPNSPQIVIPRSIEPLSKQQFMVHVRGTAEYEFGQAPRLVGNAKSSYDRIRNAWINTNGSITQQAVALGNIEGGPLEDITNTLRDGLASGTVSFVTLSGGSFNNNEDVQAALAGGGEVEVVPLVDQQRGGIVFHANVKNSDGESVRAGVVEPSKGNRAIREYIQSNVFDWATTANAEGRPLESQNLLNWGLGTVAANTDMYQYGNSVGSIPEQMNTLSQLASDGSVGDHQMVYGNDITVTGEDGNPVTNRFNYRVQINNEGSGKVYQVYRTDSNGNIITQNGRPVAPLRAFGGNTFTDRTAVQNAIFLDQARFNPNLIPQLPQQFLEQVTQ